MENSEKCVFSKKGGDCSALKKRECENCKFYKTEAMLTESLRKAEQRMNNIK